MNSQNENINSKGDFVLNLFKSLFLVIKKNLTLKCIMYMSKYNNIKSSLTIEIEHNLNETNQN